MGLKRHPALQPFSRDHLIGLFHAQRLIKLSGTQDDTTVDDVVKAFEAAYHREISIHFADEDRLIGPLHVSQKNLHRLHDEHVDLTAKIKQLITPPYSASLAAEVGNLLDAHIRWEEHDLFPEVESTLSPEQLAMLAHETELIEKSRHRKLL